MENELTGIEEIDKEILELLPQTQTMSAVSGMNDRVSQLGSMAASQRIAGLRQAAEIIKTRESDK